MGVLIRGVLLFQGVLMEELYNPDVRIVVFLTTPEAMSHNHVCVETECSVDTDLGVGGG